MNVSKVVPELPSYVEASAIESETGFYSGYGFAIPINLAKRVMDQIIAHGREGDDGGEPEKAEDDGGKSEVAKARAPRAHRSIRSITR